MHVVTNHACTAYIVAVRHILSSYSTYFELNNVIGNLDDIDTWGSWLDKSLVYLACRKKRLNGKGFSDLAGMTRKRSLPAQKP